ncbi:MAG TPA: beta-eliminating lyase-related protein [Solirubrobacteraceae bacterium]
MPKRGFTSDNAAAVHPDVLAALARENEGHAISYGHDPLTERVHATLEGDFGPGSTAVLVFNGSAANVLSLRAACRPWEAAICGAAAHLNVDEGGAPESVAGVKLLTVDTPDGKLTPELVAPRIERIGDEHAVQPRVLSITQCSELGTLYTLDELRSLSDFAREHDLLLHIDGARLANAAAALNCSLGEAATGADLLSLGGTKNGLMLGEAVIVRGGASEAGNTLAFLRKQTLQLASKMRYVSAQFDAYLHDELWRRTASHANAMATRLGAAVASIDGVEIAQVVQTNAVFARIPTATIAPLQERFAFHVWDQPQSIVRWMCAWDTTEDDVDAFAAAIADVLSAAR